MTVTVTKDKTAIVMKALKSLTSTQVLVGIPASNATRRESMISNAALGYIHEHGAPEVNIPARPWLVPSVRSIKDRTTELLKQAGTAALEGNIDRVQRIYHALGLEAQAAAKNKIQSGSFTPNKPRTLASKRRRGLGDRPLLATRQMFNAVTYVVSKK